MTRAGAAIALLMSSLLAAGPALSQEASPLGGLPPERPLAAEKKRFWLAAADFTAALTVPWIFDRYVTDEEYARISWPSFEHNIHAGFQFDNDGVIVNELGHPLHGLFFFNAGRSNGYGFWESSLFSAVGGFVWELYGENQPPSTNDFFNTALGGPVLGEASFHLSRMILDGGSGGWQRLVREMAAGLLNPVQGFNRLVTGEAWSDLPNPEGRFPGRFALSVELGGDLNREDTPFSSQAVTAVALRYGDPNEEPLQKPFDFFDLSLEAAAPAHELMSHVWVRGLLAGRGLDGRGPLSRHVLGLGMRYEYLTAGPEIFAGEAFEGGVLSLLPLGGGLQARTEAQAAFFPLAAVKTDYDALSQAAVGRNYDFSTGGGPRLDARLRRDDLDLLRVACSAIWFATWNGIASSARVQWALLEARWPVAGPLSLGAGWSWYDRVSTYPRAAAAVRAYSQGRLFASFLYR